MIIAPLIESLVVEMVGLEIVRAEFVVEVDQLVGGVTVYLVEVGGLGEGLVEGRRRS